MAHKNDVIGRLKRCQYLSTNAINVGTRRNFWKKTVTQTSTFAKNVAVQICGNYFQVFPLGRATREAIPAQPERADFLRKDVL